MYLASAEIPITGSLVITKPGCQDHCGNFSIPYPFGIGPGCFINKHFELRCNESLLNDVKPVYGSIKISNISIPDGYMTTEIFIARDCPDNAIPRYLTIATLGGTYTFSSTKNKFIGMGCNTWAYIGQDDRASLGTGCLSVCNKTKDITNGSCTGVGCCQASVPVALKTLTLQVGNMFSNTRERLSFSQFSYGFIVEERSSNFTSSYLKDFKHKGTATVPVVVDWTVGNETSTEAARNLTSYACGPNTDYIVPEGNSTIDINECNELDVCKGDRGNCKNPEGSYKCSCNKGYSVESEQSSEHQTGSATVSWENRLRIASEVAGSLAYLHSEASIPIIHRDVKSGNVLLDHDYKAKVADFGGSRLNPTDEAQLSTVVQGTFGYLYPEYMQSSQLTDKSDVYSFGVLLVELLTGKAVFSPHRLEEDRNLASYFLSSMKSNRLFAILDESLVQNDIERVSSVHGHQQIPEMAELAQKCLRMKGENRPSMKEAAVVLHGLMRIYQTQQAKKNTCSS
ncbi:hypothetical protein MKX01_015391 [Papaver californicum]|nr:hypothetical protein MKX01_015391 [Papaver californicum]